MYEERYYQPDNSESRIMNILDLEIQHNKKCESEKNFQDLIPEELIITNIIAFFFAGYDTSLQSSMSGIMNMAKKSPNWINKIKNDGVNNIDEIQKNYSLDLAIKEIQRLYNPAPVAFPRFQLKETEIAGVKFPKGTKVGTQVGNNKYNKKFIDAKEFRPERFESEVPKLGKFDYIPFYDGKRKCLGYQLGLVNMKILIGYMINKFELNAENYQVRMGGYGPYFCANPILDIKLR